MRNKYYLLSADDEQMFAEYGCRALFYEVTVLEHLDEHDADRSWVALTAENLKPEYANLVQTDLEFLLESYVLARMESLLWGHRLSVRARCSKQASGRYCINICLNASYCL